MDFLPRKTLGVSGSGLSESEDSTFSSESVLSLLHGNELSPKVLLSQSDVKSATPGRVNRTVFISPSSTY